MLTTAQFTVVRIWKQPKYSSTEKWIKKTWYIRKMEHYSAIKRNETVPFTERCMDLEAVTQTEVNQKEKTNIV